MSETKVYKSKLKMGIAYIKNVEEAWENITGEKVKFVMVKVGKKITPEVYAFFLFCFKVSPTSREKPGTFYKQCFAYLLKKNYDHGFSELGKIMGYCHATIINSCKAIQNAIDTNDSEVLNIKNEVQNFLNTYLGEPK